jgi:hypothetical protein
MSKFIELPFYDFTESGLIHGTGGCKRELFVDALEMTAVQFQRTYFYRKGGHTFTRVVSQVTLKSGAIIEVHATPKEIMVAYNKSLAGLAEIPLKGQL